LVPPHNQNEIWKRGSAMLLLKGIAWNHSRGNLPVMATAQRYMETHPNVKISWDTRSLHDFGGADVNELSKKYDLMVVDHPWTGYAAKHNSYENLSNCMESKFLEDQKNNSVGYYYESYNIDNAQLALPIDAASPIAFYSKDKLEKHGVELPKTYDDVLKLAKEGLVACSLNGTSLLMQLYMFVEAKTQRVFEDNKIGDKSVLEESLDEISNLIKYLDPSCFNANPIAVYEMLDNPNRKELYAPFDFGYSNYSRDGYGRSIISSCNTVLYNDKPLRTILGGAGLALSTHCKNKEEAVAYMQYTASGRIQKTLFVENGGQPGHRSAWIDDRANYITHDFFKNTLDTLDRAILRPRHNGYLDFQERATFKIKDYFLNKISKDEIMDFLINEYKKSFKDGD
jgi:multiple sugar transport system substrate-binding protein